MFEGLHSSRQGSVALGIAIGALSENRYIVSIPLNDVQPYDLIIDDGINGVKTVQVKSTKVIENNKHRVQISSVRSNRTKNVIHKFDNTKVDYILVITSIGKYFLIPAVEIKTKRLLSIPVGQADWRLHHS